jgi:hypothetical protein
MKKGIRSILGASALITTLAGCGVDIVKSKDNPSYNFDFDNARSVLLDEAAKLDNAGSSVIGNAYASNDNLETQVRDALDNMDRVGAGKVALDINSVQPVEGKSPDFNKDHFVNFDDFYLFVDNFGKSGDSEYDLNGNGKVGLNDFLDFAGSFGKTVNSRPEIKTFDANGTEMTIGVDDLVFSASAEDRENDELKYSWRIGEEEVELNGGVFKPLFDIAGDYTVELRVQDNFGGISNPVSRNIKVFEKVKLSPELSLPEVLRFSQYEDGEDEGNVLELNLNDYVSDPVFNDRDLTWSFDVEDNRFEHTRENGGSRNLRIPYTADALHWDFDEGNFRLDPRANYNSFDHGGKYGTFTVTNPDGESASQRVFIDVERHHEFDRLYDQVVKGKSFVEPPEYFVIWTGNSRSDEYEWPLSEAKDPKITDQEIDYLEQVATQIPEISDWYGPVEIVKTDNIDVWNSYDKRSIRAFIDNSAENGSAWGSTNEGNYDFAYIGINSMDRIINADQFPTVALHEIVHTMGTGHPTERDYSQEEYASMLFIGNYDGRSAPMSEAIVDSYNETRY